MKQLETKYIVWMGVAFAIVVIVVLFYNIPNAWNIIHRERDNAGNHTEIRPEEVLNSIYNCYNNEKRNTCFKEIAEDFVAHDALGPVFNVLEENQQTPKIFESCHVLLHFIGQSAYKKYKNVQETFTHGSHVCFAGFYHGTLEGYMMENNLLLPADGNYDALKKEIPKICTDVNQSGVKKDYYECLHGLGHALMFATDGELPQALKLCDSLASGEAGWCYSGVFMENSTSTTNPDHPSKYLKKDDPLYPCDILDEKYLHTCYILQSMSFAKLTNGNWAKNVSLCMEVPVNHRESCFSGFGQSLVGYSTDPRIVKENCLLAPSRYQYACIEGAAGAIGEKYTDPFPIVSGLCSTFKGDHKQACFKRVFSMMVNWTVEKKELERFCTGINEAELRKTCLERL